MNSALAALPVSYQDVADAADRIRPLVVETPLLEVADLSEAIGGRFFVKCENRFFYRCFGKPFFPREWPVRSWGGHGQIFLGVHGFHCH